MELSSTQIWTIIVLLGLGTFLIRFSFLGLIGDRPQPAWLLRHLRYTPVAVLPAMVGPLAVWPAATGGETDPARILAAGATLVAGYLSKSVLVGVLAGGFTLTVLLQLLGG